MTDQGAATKAAPSWRPAFAPGLEGLRGVAVLVILLYHGGIPWLTGGFLGVSTFFTLSGFLITALLLAEHEQRGRIDLPAFYGRRMRRILPAALLALTGIVVFGATVAEPAQVDRLRGDGIAALLYVTNWWLIATGAEYASQFAEPSPVQHFWSLAIEEQFYVLHPWLVIAGLGLAAGGRRTLALLLGSAIAASWAWSAWLEASLVPNARLYFGTDTRLAELLAGALLAVIADPRSRAPSAYGTIHPMCGVIGLAVSAAFWHAATPQDPRLYRGGLAIYAAASACLVAAAASNTGLLRSLLGIGPMRWLGRVSYGAYLYHWPIYLWLDETTTSLGPWSLLGLRLAATLAVADVSQRLLEEPIRRGRLLPGPSRVVAALAAATAIAAGLVIVTTTDAPPAVPTITAPAHAPAPAAGTPRIMIVGDSVAASLGPGFERWGTTTGRAVFDTRATRGCGIARGPRAGPATAAATRDRLRCDNWIMRWRPGLDTKPDIVVVLTSGWDQLPRKLPAWPHARALRDPVFDDWLREEFRHATDMLRQDGAHVVWLTAPCLQSEKGPKFLNDPALTRYFNEAILGTLVQAHPHTTLVDLASVACPGGTFAASLGNVANARPDGTHFSEAGAYWIATHLGPELAALATRSSGRTAPGSPTSRSP